LFNPTAPTKSARAWGRHRAQRVSTQQLIQADVSEGSFWFYLSAVLAAPVKRPLRNVKASFCKGATLRANP